MTAIRKMILRLPLMAGLTLTAGAARADNIEFVTENLPPFNFAEGDQVAGPSKDVIAAICAKTGDVCRFKIEPWERAMNSAKQGQVGGIFSLGKNPERELFLNYAKPLLRTEYGYFVFEKDPIEVRAAKDLAGYRVITYGKTSNLAKVLNEELVKAEPGITPDVANDMLSALKIVTGGRLGDKAAVFGNKANVDYEVKKNAIAGLRYAGKERDLLYYVAFPKAATPESTVARFITAQQELHASGDIAKILAGYGLNAPTSEQMK